MNHRVTSFLVLASLLPGVGLAQSEDTIEEELIPRYDVEVIIFKNIKTPRSREFVLPVSSPGQDGAMLDLSSAASVEAARESGYELLLASEYRLLEIVARLIDSSRYELLLHAAWRQPGLEREQVLSVWLKGGRIYGNEYTSIDNQIEFIDNSSQTEDGENSETTTYEFDEQTLESLELQLLEQQDTQRHDGLYEFEGKITIALSRYLHTYTDLILRRPRLSVDPVLSNAALDAYAAANAADTRILNNHRIKEHRRMRSRNLHYLDHPEFAMLILITPYEVAEGFEEAAIESETEAEPVAVE
ncbi:MAG: hypothetical protein GY815_07355 [Gammaproteobacteria bacterium]|nr:hypothetical protein [Gammaproteobacteria bacterium]